MKITINIPQDFEKHFNEDRFEDSLKRIKADVHDCINETAQNIPAISGNYELELIEMLIEAFKNAEVIHSTCILKGTPIEYAEWKINCDGYYPYCSRCGTEPESGKMTKYCANCGAEMKKGGLNYGT